MSYCFNLLIDILIGFDCRGSGSPSVVNQLTAATKVKKVNLNFPFIIISLPNSSSSISQRVSSHFSSPYLHLRIFKTLIISALHCVLVTLQVGLVHSLSAGGSLSSCLASHLSTQHLDSTIYELASNERFFHLSLEKICQVFVKPLRGRGTAFGK